MILGSGAALAVKQWSIGEQFRDFGRGVISLSGVAYFVMIVAVMLYLCMVLIGRRHWVAAAHRRGHGRATILVRALALVAIAVRRGHRPATPRPAAGRDQREAQLAVAADAASCSAS